jgi:hypothetical protein
MGRRERYNFHFYSGRQGARPLTVLKVTERKTKMAMVLTGAHLKRTTILRANLGGIRSKGGTQALKSRMSMGSAFRRLPHVLMIMDDSESSTLLAMLFWFNHDLNVVTQYVE